MGKHASKEDIRNVYSIKHTLGKGNFATVKYAKRKSDGHEFAVKIIKKARLDQDELKLIHDEVAIMHRVNHPHCVRMYDIFEDQKKLYIVIELLTGGELFDAVVEAGHFSEEKAAKAIRHAASALKYLHDIGIVHRDLKPENLLYSSKDDNAVIKITDFGLAKYMKDTTEMKTQCGTPGYVAPEVLSRIHLYTKAVDMWSLGVILYILLCGIPPFYDRNGDVKKVYKQIRDGAYSFPDKYWGHISSGAKDLVKQLLCVNPKDRITAEGVLKHPWIISESLSTRNLTVNLGGLAKYQARAKLRVGVRAIVAVKRFTTYFTNLSSK